MPSWLEERARELRLELADANERHRNADGGFFAGTEMEEIIIEKRLRLVAREVACKTADLCMPTDDPSDVPMSPEHPIVLEVLAYMEREVPHA